jgi:hypothetical protein
VSEIVDAIDKRNGKFVKKERKAGPWVEVDEVFAREKVGQSLRDGFSNKHRSSTMAKKQIRTQANENANGDIDRFIHSNASASHWIDELNLEVQKKGNHASGFSFMTLFSLANSDILETIKKDARLLNQFQDTAAAAADFEAILGCVVMTSIKRTSCDRQEPATGPSPAWHKMLALLRPFISWENSFVKVVLTNDGQGEQR